MFYHTAHTGHGQLCRPRRLCSARHGATGSLDPVGGSWTERATVALEPMGGSWTDRSESAHGATKRLVKVSEAGHNPPPPHPTPPAKLRPVHGGEGVLKICRSATFGIINFDNARNGVRDGRLRQKLNRAMCARIYVYVHVRFLDR